MKSSETYPDMFQNSDYYSDKEKDDLPDYYSGFNFQFKHKEENENYFNFFDKDFIFEDQSFSSEIFTTNDKPFGLKKSSSDDDIKKKYRELILKFHPDKGGDEKQFIKIQEEWEKYRTTI
mgnify:FL=1